MTSGIDVFELLGYTASALVLISLAMNSLARLRCFSLVGAACFLVYGALIDAIPIIIVNAGIVIINISHLTRMYTRKDYFEVLEVESNDPYLTAFLDFYKADIRKWYPNFAGRFNDEYLVLLTLRNLAVAGVFAGKASDDFTLNVEIDFAVPQYADRKVGRHLYQSSRGYFSKRGLRQLTVEPIRVRNNRYFQAMGFRRLDGIESNQLSLGINRNET